MIIQKIAYLYLVFPLLIFCATWFNFYTSIILLFSLIISYYFTKVSIESSEQSYILNKKNILLAVVIASIWCFWSGIGGYVYQSSDFSARNAVYRDLITRDWPVFLGQNSRYALNYYFGYWIVPALFSKFFTNDMDTLFTIGLNILLLYTIFSVFIFLLLLVEFVKPKTQKQLILVLLFPIIFSGLDIIGAVKEYIPFFDDKAYNLTSPQWWRIHIEIYNGIGEIQYSSFTTQLFWVFNQSIPCWIITMLLLKEKTPQNYGILTTAGVFYCPLPMVGISIIMLTNCILFILNNSFTLKEKIKKIISYSNIYIVPVFIIVFLFISLNDAVDNTELNFKIKSISSYLLFCYLEFLCFLFFIYRKYYKEPLFYVMIISLLTLCLFSFKEGLGDFQMRSTLSPLLLLLIFVLQYLLDNPPKFNKIMLCILLAIGIATPLVEFSRGALQIALTKNIRHTCDYWGSLNTAPYKWPFYNYVLIWPINNRFYQLFIIDD